jgi:hypothetical protein
MVEGDTLNEGHTHDLGYILDPCSDQLSYEGLSIRAIINFEPLLNWRKQTFLKTGIEPVAVG